MRKASTLLALIVVVVVGLAPTARAQTAPRRLEVGASVLPMGLGKFTALAPTGMTATVDAAFSYGLGVQVGYVILPGLTVGIAPQAFLNVKPKDQPGDAAQEFDLMARVAYTVRIADTIALYGEALPGYSLIHPPGGDMAKGPVLGFGVGAAMDLSDRTFANLGVGYQFGFQKLPREIDADTRTRYLRVALGAGMRF